MIIFPAIDLYEGKVVRLYKGDYDQMTVYSNDPVEKAYEIHQTGATHLHIVDLEGARSGTTPNIDTITRIVKETDMFVQVGGGIRSIDTVDKYISAGINRVILGTAAVKNLNFVRESVDKFGDKIAVGADIKDGFIAISGWREKSSYDIESFCKTMQQIGVSTVICTDISRDGVLSGTNTELYKKLSMAFPINFVASGGVSSLKDITTLKEMSLYGAIIGRAYYECKINLSDAIIAASENPKYL